MRCHRGGIRRDPTEYEVHPECSKDKTKKTPNSDVLRKTKKNVILMFCAKQNYSMGFFNVLLSKL
jgi:hypothetical protein